MLFGILLQTLVNTANLSVFCFVEGEKLRESMLMWEPVNLSWKHGCSVSRAVLSCYYETIFSPANDSGYDTGPIGMEGKAPTVGGGMEKVPRSSCTQYRYHFGIALR